ncbi:MAG: hypothetical protein ACXWEY_11790, partial [Bacteroidia bacterium]
MRKRNVLLQVIVLTFLFLQIGLSSSFAAGNGKPETQKFDSAYSEEVLFLQHYSKRLGYNIDT